MEVINVPYKIIQIDVRYKRKGEDGFQEEKGVYIVPLLMNKVCGFKGGKK